MIDAEAWLVERSAGAPSDLVDRARVHLAGTTGRLQDRLAEAGRRALAVTLEGGSDRSVALDLLAADALVTLALEAQAELDPSGLADFAARLRRAAVHP